jgi:predicted TIM-barrel fold metal-dependent hydrolase
MYPIQYQANLDREKVRNFMIKYQDRILYGTDAEVHDDPAHNVSEILVGLHRVWLNQWIYMTTDSTVEFKGLKLPKEVIDKIYYRNAEQYFRKN